VVARYKELAGIEKHSQTALSEAHAAETEADHVANGYHDKQGQLCVAVTGTPQIQHLVPAVDKAVCECFSMPASSLYLATSCSRNAIFSTQFCSLF
jgi:hypothetical protein